MLVPDSLRRKKREPPQKLRRAGGKQPKKRCEGGGSESEESGDEETPFFSHLEGSETSSDKYKTTAVSTSVIEPLGPTKSSAHQTSSFLLSVSTVPPPLPSVDATPSPCLTREAHASSSGYHDNSSTDYSQLYHTQYGYGQYSITPSVGPVAGDPGLVVGPPLDQTTAADDTSNAVSSSSSGDNVMFNEDAVSVKLTVLQLLHVH